MADDLWGDLPTGEGVKTPHSILVEQAQLLTKKTSGLLVGSTSRLKGSATAYDFVSNLRILAPSLNYSFQVTSLFYNFDLYPAVVSPPPPEPDIQVTDEAHLNMALREILTSERIRKAIAGLLAQIRADAKEEDSE